MSKAKIVNAGVDTLVLNAFYIDERGKPIKCELDSSLRVQLDEWKRAAQEAHEECPTTLTFNGAVVHMFPNGAGQGQWPWMLKSRDITLYVSSGHWNGIASLRLGSQYLWSCQGVLDAIMSAQAFLDEVKSNEYSVGFARTGYDFSRGKHGSSSLSCRMYDKSREIVQSGKEWFLDLWQAHGWREEDGHVWRVEFSFKREALHELQQENTSREVVFWGVEDAYELPERLPVLWAYATGQVEGGPDGEPDGWLRYVVESSDKNRSRWPTHLVWQLIQTAFLDQTLEVPPQFGTIVRKRWQEHNVEKGIEAVMGYLTSLAAWAGGELAEDGVDLSVVLHWLALQGDVYLERVKRDFSAEVQRKRLKFGLQSA